ncbi:hypothetical protein GCK72_006476 [Caenorhabditis remanei]|uniref:Uncharacterized protein n=1 Tax=Caenorhabditis remanei TaxID=31234 RepID=E3LQF3_CAERE|nr:hypothetical protein GCK72_006476 [Caenorhabditis remanei]EFP07405.1 hypothetical protein CRE_26145 [Caenorhabditis remanei]KAF1766519.1 hypothetical protein GCK72_006476 [Caenorhabditis remanei]
MNVFHVFVLLLAFFTSTSSSFPTPLVNRDTRALAPSVESWCIFYPEKCRMLRFAGTHKRYILDDVEY